MFISDKQKKRIIQHKNHIESIVKDITSYKEGETFEQLVERKFKLYYGKTVNEIEHVLKIKVSDSAKAMSYTLCRAILGVKSSKIAEFEKAGVQLKTIRLEENGTLKESMVFSQIKWKEIAEEKTWEESSWHDTLTKRFFFVVFRKHGKGNDKSATLEKTFFWTMPHADLLKAKCFWQDTRDKVRAGKYDSFIKISEHPICHVRPKAKDSHDLMLTPQGTYERKKGYWLNRNYILNIVRQNLNNK